MSNDTVIPLIAVHVAVKVMFALPFAIAVDNSITATLAPAAWIPEMEPIPDTSHPAKVKSVRVYE
jgi:hypothetical protein